MISHVNEVSFCRVSCVDGGETDELIISDKKN